MAYKCRAYPTPEQAAVLNRTFGCVRLVWNRTLAWRHARYHGEHAKTTTPGVPSPTRPRKHGAGARKTLTSLAATTAPP